MYFSQFHKFMYTLMYFPIIYLFLLQTVLTLQIEKDQPQIDEAPCGPYGFRCIDETSFQVCAYPDFDGQIDEPETVHECHEDYSCDEDNPAYCTPVDIITIINITTEKPFAFRRQLKKFMPALENKKLFARNDEQQNEDINNEKEAAQSENLEYNLNEFNCERYGYFEGKSDKIYLYDSIYL